MDPQFIDKIRSFFPPKQCTNNIVHRANLIMVYILLSQHSGYFSTHTPLSHTHAHAHTLYYRPIDDTNKGRKMLEKMGWKKGEGLGRENEGRAEPVSYHK